MKKEQAKAANLMAIEQDQSNLMVMTQDQVHNVVMAGKVISQEE